jgi:hypothetical protein
MTLRTSAGERSALALRLASTALSSVVCNDGSCSSRYSATCSSVTLRRSGRTRKKYRLASSATANTTRAAMMEAGENFAHSMP